MRGAGGGGVDAGRSDAFHEDLYNVSYMYSIIQYCCKVQYMIVILYAVRYAVRTLYGMIV